MIQLIWRDELEPCSFYIFRLYEGERSRRRVRSFLTGWEFNQICRYACRQRGLEVGQLARKDRFAGFCLRHGLPGVASLRIEPGEDASGALPRSDLFAKPVDRFGGEGCILIPYEPEAERWRLGEEAVAADALKAALDRWFGDEPYLVQERLRNHSSLLRFSRSTLCTVRMLTAMNGAGRPVVARATFRFPADPEAVIDNSCRGGWSAPVCPVRGFLTAPARVWEDDRELAVLDDGTELGGFSLPFWKEAVAAVCRAQEAAWPFNLLGWDVALTDGGPVITECNVWSDIELVEIPQRLPILSSDVLALLRADPSLRRWLEKEATHPRQTEPPFKPGVPPDPPPATVHA